MIVSIAPSIVQQIALMASVKLVDEHTRQYNDKKQ